MNEPEKLGQILPQVLPHPESDSICEKCKRDFKHSDKNGSRLKWCKRCIDIYNRQKSLSVSKAEKEIVEAVGTRYAQATIEDLEPEIRGKLLSAEPSQDIFLFGDIGVGKTYAMAALYRYYIYEGFECRRINFDDFCVLVRSTFTRASKITEYELVEPLKRVDKLFLDDLGLKNDETGFAYMTLFAILNKRQERMLPTLITTNKTVEELGRSFDARVESRLKAAMIIKMTGKDRRQEIKDKYK